MHRKILIILVLLAVNSLAKADNPRAKALIKEGLRIFNNEQYAEATEYFTKAISLDAESAEAHYYLGECYRHLFAYEKATPQYQRTLACDSTAFPLAHYYVALTQKQAGQYRTAFRSFNYFLDFAQQHRFKEQKRWISQAKKEIEGILLVYELAAKPQGNFSLARLPYPVNSDYNDYAAQVYQHDSSLVLSSARPTTKGSIYDEKYGEYLGDHFVYEKQPGWVDHTGRYQVNQLNTPLNEGTGVFSSSGDQFYFTGCYDDGACQIYVSQRTGQQWSTPQALPPEINAPNSSSKHPALTPDGNTLYFASDRPGGAGDNDIWISKRKQGVWQPAVNAGPVINTAQNEVSPYYYAAERQLLFASDGHVGMGGYDLFFADLNVSPASVTNAGYPFNSHKDDLYLHLGQERGFLTSNRANRDGNFDIYGFLINTGDISLVALANSRQQTDWYETQFTFSETFDSKDRPFYEQLPPEDKQQVRRYVERVAFQQALSEYEGQAEGQRLVYEKLSPSEQETVQRLVIAKKQFLLENNTDQLLPDDQHYYESLPAREREKIDQLVDTRLFTLLSQEGTADASNETYFYESLSPKEKEMVSGAIRKQQKFYQKSLEAPTTVADLFHYQTLTSKEKEQVEALARTRNFALKEEQSLPEKTQFFYEKLSDEDQASVERMAQARLLFLTKGTQQSLQPEDYQFLTTLSPQEKEQVQQLIDHRIRRLYLLKSQDDPLISLSYDYEQLPPQEKAQLQRLIQAKKLAHKVVKPMDDYSGPFDLGKIADALPEKVSIRGRFKAQPSIDVARQLTIYDQQRGTTLHAERDGENGFVFSNIDYHQNLRISFSGVTRSFTELPQDEIAELAITVLQDTIIQEVFDNIYFDTNKYFIVDSAKHVLDSLSAFHHKYPDVMIQIKAFADSTGTDAYNMKLSKQRAQSITTYLTQHGVDVRSIQPIPMGAEKSSDLNYSRRVEFDIRGVSASYNPTREIYVIQSEPNLEEVARQYQVPLEKLIEWNGGKRVIEPYSPIKIMAKRKYTSAKF